MKKLLAVIALVLSVSAFAAEKVSFSYNGNEGWGRTFYACDFVESQTEMYLELFGATEVEVNCFGGISSGGYATPVSVSASFVAPILTGTEVAEEVKVTGDTWTPACGLNVTIIKNLLKKLPNVTVISKSDACAFQSSNFSYTFSIKK